MNKIICDKFKLPIDVFDVGVCQYLRLSDVLRLYFSDVAFTLYDSNHCWMENRNIFIEYKGGIYYVQPFSIINRRWIPVGGTAYPTLHDFINGFANTINST